MKAEHSLKPDEFLSRTKYISQEYSRVITLQEPVSLSSSFFGKKFDLRINLYNPRLFNPKCNPGLLNNEVFIPDFSWIINMGWKSQGLKLGLKYLNPRGCRTIQPQVSIPAFSNPVFSTTKFSTPEFYTINLKIKSPGLKLQVEKSGVEKVAWHLNPRLFSQVQL